MDRFIFVYDALLTKAEQEKIGVPMEFVSLAQINAKRYRMRMRKKGTYKHFILLPNNMLLNVVYGAIFLIRNYHHHRHKLCAYYHNSKPYTGNTLDSDYFDEVKASVTPIKINSIWQLEKGDYVRGDKVEATVFVGNKNCDYVMTHTHYHNRQKNVDRNNFIKMIKEQQGENYVGV